MRKNWDVSITDELGNVVLQASVKSESETQKIASSQSLPKGHYAMTVSDGNIVNWSRVQVG